MVRRTMDSSKSTLTESLSESENPESDSHRDQMPRFKQLDTLPRYFQNSFWPYGPTHPNQNNLHHSFAFPSFSFLSSGDSKTPSDADFLIVSVYFIILQASYFLYLMSFYPPSLAWQKEIYQTVEWRNLKTGSHVLTITVVYFPSLPFPSFPSTLLPFLPLLSLSFLFSFSSLSHSVPTAGGRWAMFHSVWLEKCLLCSTSGQTSEEEDKSRTVWALNLTRIFPSSLPDSTHSWATQFWRFREQMKLEFLISPTS